ncbi:MAG: biotin--[acetyl-CoA-carboxylase] ligase [Desulfocapsa sp.]|nr:biotin--[acetyl-CoA-carboxylase] ligase [Desulfocapsa sp.]
MDNIFHLISTVSTNEDAYGLALKGAEHGTAVLADAQHGGKGRLGREWASPPGTGLYCSIVIRPNLPFPEFPKLTLTAGLALCTVIERLVPTVPFGLKWPNDLYCNGRKAGGILVESSSPLGDGDPFAVVGVGVNVNTRSDDFPVGLREKGTSLLMESGNSLDIYKLFEKLHVSLLGHIGVHEQQDGFAEILKEWRKRDLLLGKEMQWLTSDKKVIVGRGMGPDGNGQLLARDREGKVHEILSGDVQLFESDQGK